MGYCNHPFDTQTNEALNQAIAKVAPKSVCYSSTTSLNARIALVIGVHNLGHLPFFSILFDKIGVEMGNNLSLFLKRKQTKKEAKQQYQKQGSTKIKRSQQQQKTRQQIFLERTNASYGSGIGLTAGITKKRKRGAMKEMNNKKDNTCKCGSTTHKRTTHKDCTLNKNIPLQVTPVTSQQEHTSASTDTLHIDEILEWDDGDSEREEQVRHMVNMMCLESSGDFSDEDSIETGTIPTKKVTWSGSPWQTSYCQPSRTEAEGET
jgi:hypothetical protein